MRELTTQEVEVVSGAGLFRDLTGWAGQQAGGLIGQALGSLVVIPVVTTVVSNITGYIGKQVGGFIGDAFGSFVEGLFGGNNETPSA